MTLESTSRIGGISRLSILRECDRQRNDRVPTIRLMCLEPSLQCVTNMNILRGDDLPDSCRCYNTAFSQTLFISVDRRGVVLQDRHWVAITRFRVRRSHRCHIVGTPWYEYRSGLTKSCENVYIHTLMPDVTFTLKIEVI